MDLSSPESSSLLLTITCVSVCRHHSQPAMTHTRAHAIITGCRFMFSGLHQIRLGENKFSTVESGELLQLLIFFSKKCVYTYRNVNGACLCNSAMVLYLWFSVLLAGHCMVITGPNSNVVLKKPRILGIIHVHSTNYAEWVVCQSLIPYNRSLFKSLSQSMINSNSDACLSKN